MTLKNIDDLLVKSMNEQLDPNSTQSDLDDVISTPELSGMDHSQEDIDQHEPQKELAPKVEEPKKEEIKSEESQDSPIDEYGNPVEKDRLYTKEEMQEIIRDRVARIKHPQQQEYHPPAQQQTQQDQPQSDDDAWLASLDSVIDNRLDTRQREYARQQWQQQEAKRQADFELKFSSGKERYNDFDKVVSNNPINELMMLATRGLDNPAAFFYGASKLHPQELKRIYQIDDPYIQAAEVGRLHEKMIKQHKVVTTAAKPLEPPKGDMGQKQNNDTNIDDRIRLHAKQKFRR